MILVYMTKADIITIPDPLLRQKSTRITRIDDSTRLLAENMISATLDWEDSRSHEIGAALAAVQVAKPYRLIIIRRDFENKDDRRFDVFINPEIVKTEGEITEELEGCLSVANIYGHVPRFSKIKVKALDLEGKPVRITASGFRAIVFQHEIDHTNGLVFVDRISDPGQLYRLEADGEFTSLNPAS